MINVYGTENKKMLNILILEILKTYSDDEHHLTQQEIMRKLKADYGIEKIDRRSVKANVISLRDMGYEIGGLEEDDPDNDGYYLEEREFEDEELRILIDSVLFSKTLSDSAAKRLIEKLKGFGNIYFDAKVSHVKPIRHYFIEQIIKAYYIMLVPSMRPWIRRKKLPLDIIVMVLILRCMTRAGITS